MLFFQHDKYYTEFTVFGHPDQKGGVRDEFTLNRMEKISYQQFSRVHDFPSDAKPLVSIEGISMSGYIDVDPKHLSVHENGLFGDLSLGRWMLWHLTGKSNSVVSNPMDFETWFKTLPIGRNKKMGGVMRSTDGKFYLVIYCNGAFELTELTESCFIRNLKITSLERVMEKELDIARRQVQSIEDKHAKYVGDSTFELASKLSGDRSLLSNISHY